MYPERVRPSPGLENIPRKMMGLRYGVWEFDPRPIYWDRFLPKYLCFGLAGCESFWDTNRIVRRQRQNFKNCQKLVPGVFNTSTKTVTDSERHPLTVSGRGWGEGRRTYGEASGRRRSSRRTGPDRV